MEQIELNGTIKDWLFSIYHNGVDNVNPSDCMVEYKPLNRGNDKLDKSILSFNLLPIVTCGGKLCEGCYDIRAFRNPSVRLKRYVNTSMATHNIPTLQKLIIKQIKNSRTCKYVRIHVGGDMFSSGYVKMWKDIAKEIGKIKPDIIFYTYTKTRYAESLRKAGINVVQSKYTKGFNYGSLEYIKALKAEYGGVLCPATLKKSDEKICGVTCDACMKCKNVYFKQH